jgi:hypothetical protein
MHPAPLVQPPQVVAVAHTFVEVWEGVIGIIAELDVLAGG